MIGIFWWICAVYFLIKDIKIFKTLDAVPLNHLIVIGIFVICGAIFVSRSNK